MSSKTALKCCRQLLNQSDGTFFTLAFMHSRPVTSFNGKISLALSKMSFFRIGCQRNIQKRSCAWLTWQLWMASLKKSSNNRFWREGFLINASLMLPRKTLQINERERIWKGCEQWQGKMGDFLVRLVEKEVTSTWTISFFNRFTSRLHFREREALR